MLPAGESYGQFGGTLVEAPPNVSEQVAKSTRLISPSRVKSEQAQVCENDADFPKHTAKEAKSCRFTDAPLPSISPQENGQHAASAVSVRPSQSLNRGATCSVLLGATDRRSYSHT